MEKCCFKNFEPNKLPESNNCSRTLPFASNNHVSQAIYVNGQKMKEVIQSS